jgi:hypothetical protein
MKIKCICTKESLEVVVDNEKNDKYPLTYFDIYEGKKCIGGVVLNKYDALKLVSYIIKKLKG